MKITKLSSEGQVIIPKSLREAHHREVGQVAVPLLQNSKFKIKKKDN